MAREEDSESLGVAVDVCLEEFAIRTVGTHGCTAETATSAIWPRSGPVGVLWECGEPRDDVAPLRVDVRSPLGADASHRRDRIQPGQALRILVEDEQAYAVGLAEEGQLDPAYGARFAKIDDQADPGLETGVAELLDIPAGAPRRGRIAVHGGLHLVRVFGAVLALRIEFAR